MFFHHVYMLRCKRRYLRYVFRMEFHQQREQLDLIQRLPLCSTARNRLPKDPIISESQWPIQTFRLGGGGGGGGGKGGHFDPEIRRGRSPKILLGPSGLSLV